MARATYVKKAQKDIWQHGVSVIKVHENGKNKGQKYQTRDTSQPRDDKDVLLVKKGEGYWQWAFRFGGKHVSKEQPKRSQLTQSEWLSRAYALEEQMAEATADSPSDLESLKDDWCSEIESMREEAEERLENMPEGLRENSSSGQTLQEYIDAFDNWHQELDAVDTDIDEEQIRADAEADHEGMTVEEKITELLDEKIEEVLNEMTSTSGGL